MMRGASGPASEEGMVSFPPLMRQTLYGIVFGMPLLAGVGNWWCAQPGGAGTRVVLDVARAICPHPGVAQKRVSVGDGAHALDRAVLRRLGDLLADVQRCRVHVGDTGEHGTAADQIAGRLVRRRHRR